MCVSFSGSDINKILNDCRDIYRSGNIYMEPALASKYSEVIAYLTKEIENRPDISSVLKFLLVDVKSVSLDNVSNKTGVDCNTLAKYVSGTRNPSVGVVIAVCLYLTFPPQVTYAVLKKTHYNFLAGNKRDTAYLTAIDHYWMIGNIPEINYLLNSQGLKPLTKTSPEKQQKNKIESQEDDDNLT